MKASLKNMKEQLKAKQPKTIDVEAVESPEDSPEQEQPVATPMVKTGKATAAPAVVEKPSRDPKSLEVPAKETALDHPAQSSGWSQASGGAIEGDWDSGDIKYPALKIAQGSGSFASKFTTGSIVWGESEIVPTPKPPTEPGGIIRFIPVSIKKQFRQNLSQEEIDAGLMPEVVDSLQEVHDRGGTTRFGADGEKPSWSPCGRCIMLIERPDTADEDAVFSELLDDKEYGVGIWYASGSGYRRGLQPMFNKALSACREPAIDEDGNPVIIDGRKQFTFRLHKFVWTFQTTRQQMGNFNVYVPVLRMLKDTPGPEAAEFCDTLLEQFRSM